MRRTNKKSTSPLIWLGRIVCLLFLVGSLGFIFLNSLKNGILPENRSKEILVVINHIMEDVGASPITHKMLRKTVHFGEFVLVGFWISMCMRMFTAHILMHISFPLFWGLLIAVCDETLQFCISERGSNIVDIFVDFSGILTGVAVAFFICMIFAIVAFTKEKRSRKKARDVFFYWG